MLLILSLGKAFDDPEIYGHRIGLLGFRYASA